VRSTPTINKEIFYIIERLVYENWSALRVSHRGGTGPGSEADLAPGPLSCGCEAVADTAGRPVSARSAGYKYPEGVFKSFTTCLRLEREPMRLRSGREVECVNVHGSPKEKSCVKEEGGLLIIQVRIQQDMLLDLEEGRQAVGYFKGIFGTLLCLSLIIGLLIQKNYL